MSRSWPTGVESCTSQVCWQIRCTWKVRDRQCASGPSQPCCGVGTHRGHSFTLLACPPGTKPLYMTSRIPSVTRTFRREKIRGEALGVALPSRVYYRNAQISAVGREKDEEVRLNEAHHLVDDGGDAGSGEHAVGCVRLWGAQTAHGQGTQASNEDCLDPRLPLQAGPHHHQAGDEGQMDQQGLLYSSEVRSSHLL